MSYFYLLFKYWLFETLGTRRFECQLIRTSGRHSKQNRKNGADTHDGKRDEVGQKKLFVDAEVSASDGKNCGQL